MKSKLIATLCLATYLGGCTMIPDMRNLNFGESKTWNNIPAHEFSIEDGTAADTGWQSFFLSDGLKQVIQTTIKNNKDLKIAALNIDEARALYRINRADLVPSLNANGNATIQKSSDQSSVTGTARKTENYAANIAVPAYELDIFGRIRSQNTAALNDYAATMQARDAVQNALIGEVANAYLQYLADLKILELTKNTLNTQKESYDLVKVSFDNGIGTELDIAAAETTVESARANYYQYQRLVEQDKNALFLLMGIANDDTMLPLASLSDVKVKDNLDPGVPSQVLLSRPDVKAAEFQLLSANADIGAARAAFFPSISLTGAFGFASDDLGNLFTSGAAGAWNFIPQITLPIFNGGVNKRNLELAEIRKNIAILNYEKTIQVAFKEVADELDARKALDKQLAAQKRLVTASRKLYNLTKVRYKSGIDNFTDVLIAQRQLYTNQQAEILLEQQRLANLINLYKVLGGGRDDEQAIVE